MRFLLVLISLFALSSMSFASRLPHGPSEYFSGYYGGHVPEKSRTFSLAFNLQEGSKSYLLELVIRKGKLVDIYPLSETDLRESHDPDGDEVLNLGGWKPPMITKGVVAKKYGTNGTCFSTSLKSVHATRSDEKVMGRYVTTNYNFSVPKPLQYCGPDRP
jgi:hypothetical protein